MPYYAKSKYWKIRADTREYGGSCYYDFRVNSSGLASIGFIWKRN